MTTHHSGFIAYACGPLLSVSASAPVPAASPEPCPACSLPPVNPDWCERGAWCRAQRRATWPAAIAQQPRGRGVSFSDVGAALGVSAAAVSGMEMGRQDPTRLEAFWRERQA